MHKPGNFYKILGTLHTSKFFYMHFTYHHLYRHHVWVGTPLDPSTARKGEYVYTFILKSIVYSWKYVFEDEKKAGKSLLTNYGVLSIVSSLVFAFGIYVFFGIQALIIHSIMVFIAISYLEAINYVEHYGLSRKLLPNNEYEKVNIYHSWNAPHRFTNYFFFKVQRHSDHHENSSKPYQTLTSMEESPFLPHGYILMIVMSFFPSVTLPSFRFGSKSWIRLSMSIRTCPWRAMARSIQQSGTNQ
jgi:alkane 1-monooxygenase